MITANQILRVGLFEHRPFITKVRGHEYYSGIEVRIIQEFARVHSLRLSFHEPSDANLWGNLFPNGTSTGLLGDITEGSVDLVMAQFFAQAARFAALDAAESHGSDGYCFLVPKPRPLPKVAMLAMPLDAHTWVGAVVSVMVGTAVAVLLLGREGNTPGKVVMLCLGIVLSQPTQIRPR